MKTAIIILNYNSSNDTIRYVNKIKEFNCIDTIVVVDNLSTEPNCMEKLEELKSEKTHVIRSEKNGGYSYGNNYGIRYLDNLNEKYDYIIISNPDIDIEENTIVHCLNELESNKKMAVIAPRMYDKNGKPIRRSSWKIRTPIIDMVNSTRVNQFLFNKVFKSGEYSAKEFEKDKLKVEAVSGAFFIIKYDILKKCDFFDENVFLFYEEDILASKIKRMGYEECSLNSEKFIHYESQSINKALNYFNKMKRMQKSKMYYQKTYNNINMFQIIIFEILNFWKKVELLIEIPIRKILKK